jgi:hypothetical protein
MPPVLPSPSHFAAPSWAAWGFLFYAGALAVLLALPWALSSGFRKRNWLPLIMLGSGFLCSLLEPMLDFLGNLHALANRHPSHQFTAFPPPPGKTRWGPNGRAGKCTLTSAAIVKPTTRRWRATPELSPASLPRILPGKTRPSGRQEQGDTRLGQGEGPGCQRARSHPCRHRGAVRGGKRQVNRAPDSPGPVRSAGLLTRVRPANGNPPGISGTRQQVPFTPRQEDPDGEQNPLAPPPGFSRLRITPALSAPSSRGNARHLRESR